MSSPPVKLAETGAKIHFAINLLHESFWEIIRDKFNVGKKEDFLWTVKFLRDKLKDKASDLFPDQKVQEEFVLKLNRAKNIRNKYCHQSVHINQFEHDVECLIRLATLLDLTLVRHQIIQFTGVSDTQQSCDQDWEKTKNDGNELYGQGRWTEAMNCYTKAIRINPNIDTLYSSRALCEIKLSKFELAREDAEDAIQRNPDNVEFYRIQSEALCGLTRYAKAIGACQNGLKLDPNDKVLQSRLKKCQDALVYQQATANMQTDSATSDSKESLPDEDTVKTLGAEITRARQLLQMARGNPQKEQESLKIFEMAAKRGSAEALYNMALMYRDGQAGLPKDPRKFFDLCRQAVVHKPYVEVDGRVLQNTGVAESENLIGVALRDSLGVEKDEKAAFQWFFKSAQHGCLSAMYNLGLALTKGTGCQVNFESARMWYQKSADCESESQSQAQFSLAQLYINGQGGTEDFSKAKELLKAASDQGLPKAYEELQRISRLVA